MTEVLQDRADALLRDAHRRSYRFPDSLVGFRAAVRWSSEDGAGEGALVVRLGSEPRVQLEADDAPEWVTGDLQSIVSHRASRRYEDGDGARPKRVSDSGPLGDRVELADEFDSSYVVGDGRIALVSRAHRGERFTIAVQQRAAADDGTEVPTAFAVAYWGEDGRLLRTEAYADRYAEFAGALVPAGRTVVTASADGIESRRIELSGHQPVAVGCPR
jgi:hypothetical protein